MSYRGFLLVRDLQNEVVTRAKDTSKSSRAQLFAPEGNVKNRAIATALFRQSPSSKLGPWGGFERSNVLWTHKTGKRLRQGFNYFNRFMLLMWRLGLGDWINVWPVVDGEVYCTAGFGSISDWYRNIMSRSSIEVWMPGGWWEGVAEDISAHPQRTVLMRQVLIGAGFAAHLFGVNPHKLSDAELQAVTSSYRLVHIRRTAPRTGRDGPGDLAWIWPLATFILLPLAIKKKKS
ncbi:MAG: hypothetical protein WB239_16875 [Acidimicrobiia bacterium]